MSRVSQITRQTGKQGLKEGVDGADREVVKIEQNALKSLLGLTADKFGLVVGVAWRGCWQKLKNGLAHTVGFGE